MRLSQLIERLHLKPIVLMDGEREIKGGFSGDLLSFVMGNALEGQVWLTIQTHPNIVAVASLKELAAIILCSNRTPEVETITKAKEMEINLLLSEENTFTTSGRIYQLLRDECPSFL